MFVLMVSFKTKVVSLNTWLFGKCSIPYDTHNNINLEMIEKYIHSPITLNVLFTRLQEPYGSSVDLSDENNNTTRVLVKHLKLNYKHFEILKFEMFSCDWFYPKQCTKCEYYVDENCVKCTNGSKCDQCKCWLCLECLNELKQSVISPLPEEICNIINKNLK